MIEKIGHYSITNPATVYDEEAMTALELAGRTAGKVNECVEHFNTLKTETDEHLAKQDETIPVEVEKSVQKHINDGDFDQAIDEYAGNLEDRVNNLLNNVPEGSTTMDAEVIDIRQTDMDSTPFPTAGEAVRYQFQELKFGTSKKNLIDLNALVGGYVQETGALHPSQQSSTFQRWEYTTDFIPVNTARQYYLSIYHDKTCAGWFAISTYTANKAFINRDRTYEYNAKSHTRKVIFYTSDSDVAFVRISFRSYMHAEIKFEQSMYASQIQPREVKNNLLDTYPLQFGGYIVDNGSIFPQTGANYIQGEPALLEKYTRHIPVKAGESYTVYHIADAHAWGVVGIYGEDGNAIQRITVSNTKNTFVIPAGGVSIMVCARTHYLKDLALFKNVSPMTADQRTYENYLNLEEIPTNEPVEVVKANVKAINHRGYSSEATENTLEAFRRSAEHGFKYVECDVRFTYDGVPVLLHDETVDRVSNGTGYIHELTFSYVQRLNFGGQKIATFQEFIALCKGLGLHPYIELKECENFDVEKILGIVQMYGMSDNVTYITFSDSIIESISIYDRLARVGFLLNEVNEDAVEYVRYCRTLGMDAFINAASSAVNDDAVQLCASNHVPLEVWTVNNPSYITNMNAYITGVTSDSVHAGEVLRDTYFTGKMTTIPTFKPVRGGLFQHRVDICIGDEQIIFECYNSYIENIDSYEKFINAFYTGVYTGGYFNQENNSFGFALFIPDIDNSVVQIMLNNASGNFEMIEIDITSGHFNDFKMGV